MSPRVWLVTGSSSGFGRATTEYALSKGEKVVATLRKPSDLADLQKKFPASQLLVVQLDVTDPKAILDAFSAGKKAFGRIDVVFNNAGWTAAGEVEGTPDDVAKKLFDVNFWGATNVTKEAVRFFREENPSGAGGRLLVVSSFVGLKPLPIGGYYSASKHALEGVTQSLAEEISPEWNIKITSVLPGQFRTSVMQNGFMAPPHPAYGEPTNPAFQVRKAVVAAAAPDFKLNDVAKGARKIYEISELADPPYRIIFGTDAVGFVQAQLDYLKRDLDSSASWGEGLKED
ncbi:hypothetical protein PHLGIDRAFT_124234 [Phlebiopsis gigantea 11061_1 CR5-6]|uniref:NAD-P-binding protein n=1 Tax=Phlebiopsis gigantea (strain 11061_1 CR5-6) TaxID=745531 RepID=A0A0C3PWH8_PHLG1|nr:hypothetical protein PHLGIDRAFT_124234 [Phlebiopsis gigantea 11061_1 CR5-6]